MRYSSKFILLSSTMILGAFVNSPVISADQLTAEKVSLKTVETATTERITADIQASLLDGKPILRLSNVSAKGVQAVKITISSKSDDSDKHTYTAELDKDGSYVVKLDRTFHDKTGKNFKAKVALERSQGITDFLSDYPFIWTDEEPVNAESTEPTKTTTEAALAETSSSSVETTQTSPTEPTTTPAPTETATTSSAISTEQASARQETKEIKPDIKGDSEDKENPESTEPAQSTTPVQAKSTTSTASSSQATTKEDKNRTETPSTVTETAYFGTEPILRNATSGLQTTGTLTVVKNQQTGSFEVTVSNVDSADGVEEVLLPIWSAAGGQDDINWYRAKKQADNTFKAMVSISDHKNDLGEYYIHLYYIDRKKKLIGVGGTTTTISKTATQPTGKMTITTANAVTGAFDVVVSDIYAPNGLKEVLIPVWSDQGGQDDIHWYNATKQMDGSYKITVDPANHKNNQGIYHAHLYFRQNDGQLKGISTAKTTVKTVPLSGKITITNNNQVTGSFDILVTEVASQAGVSEVLVPVWGETNGQNDIRWYNAARQSDGSYKVSVKSSDHQFETGTYHAHLYYRQSNGQLKGVGGTQTLVKSNTSLGKLTITNQNKQTGSFDVTITDVNPGYGVSEILLPTWSDKSGQDDIQWYRAEKQADGSYKASISISNHKFDTGTYHVHYYHRTADGQLKGIGGIQTTVEASATQPTGHISVSKNNNGFDVVISGVYAPSGVKEVSVPIWSEAGGQDDIRWYTATKQADGNYSVSVNLANHNNTSGKYNIHLYYRLNSGQFVGVGGTTTQATAQTVAATMSTSYQGTGQYTVDFANIYGQGRVNVAIWSDTGGQDDLIWYVAQSLGNGRYQLNFNVQNHSGIGTYHIHAYLTNSQNVFQTSGTIQVARTNYTAPYYSQNDGRWGGIVYGQYSVSYSGCVPTAVAMAATGITGRTITPNDVASYLYYNTQEFNRIHGAGTTGTGLVQAANHFGLRATALHGQNALINALQNGQFVAAAVGHSVFVKSPATHQLLLKGYQNGKTYVMDPYTPSMNGWYDVSYLTSVPSNWSGDLYQGSVFIQLSE
ncbi:GBS Bsp-like repeat-containing protein [Streptococcus merionis]|uniref:N-acetylmuramidase n=1 Tax=Streptococcus merionis TaxID=400065 RepID=A0A239T023_9STRE|nr:GBS Bsp-like repeat-containing protein [Streptococcus merionis]SNU90849.1 N-acetylmuramidase [Streptococcus merionis]